MQAEHVVSPEKTYEICDRHGPELRLSERVVVVTGTRRGLPYVWDSLLTLFAGGVPKLLVVGDQVGVDDQARRLWLALARARMLPAGAKLRVVYVDKNQPSPERYHNRNERMSESGRAGDLCLAFPDELSRGTWDCVARCRARGMAIAVAKPPEVDAAAPRGALS